GEVRVCQIGTGKVRAGQVAADQHSVPQRCTAEVRGIERALLKLCFGKIGAFKVGSLSMYVVEYCRFQLRSGEDDSGVSGSLTRLIGGVAAKGCLFERGVAEIRFRKVAFELRAI